MGALDFPELSRDDLAGMGSWTVLRQARDLFRQGAVKAFEWSSPELTGTVVDDGSGYRPVLDLRSLTFTRNACQCPPGRRGQVCAHALALCLAMQQSEAQPPPAPPEPAAAGTIPAPPAPPGPRSLRLDPAGKPLGLRFRLPPNLEAAAGRNAIVVKIEYTTKAGSVAPEKLHKGGRWSVGEGVGAVVSFLEEIGSGSVASLVQLKRSQLDHLIRNRGAAVVLQGTGEDPIEDSELRSRILPLLEAPEPPAKEPAVRRSRGVARRRAPEPPGPAPVRELLPDNWMVVDGSPKFLSILLKERDHPQYRRCVEWLRSEGFRKEPSNGKWWLRDQHKVLNFLALHRERLEADYDPGYTDNFKERTGVIKPVPLTCQTESGGGGYSLRMELRAEGLEIADIRNALVSGRHYIIGDDAIHLLEKAVLEKFEAAARTLGGDPGLPMTGVFKTRLSNAELVHAESVLEELDEEVPLPADWKERSAAIREVGRLEKPPLPGDVGGRFRAYQLVGTAWLWHLYRNRLGGILADEMGLGKTIQAIGLMLCWKQTGVWDGPALVVAPASLLGNWQRELSVWGPGLEVYVHHGPSRLDQFDGEAFHPDVCLTSYSTLRNDREQFHRHAFSLAIADEAQHVKNRRSYASRALRAITASSRFVLTGTPIENSIADLRALFDFCLPGYLKRPPSDLRGEDREWHEKEHLRKAAPYILRRGKAMVAPELPDKIEQTVWCGLGDRQQALYQKVRQKTEETLMKLADAGASENRLRFTMLTELLRLRQVCADPGLLDRDFSLEESGKFQAFRELVSEAMDGEHRILVFSQFVQLLKRLRGWLDREEIRHAYIDGATRDRLGVCDRFNTDPGITVCLISLKAGGTGLNLTGADTVVHFDPWWNPAVEDQATDRAHRIGQSRTVTSYKLVTEGTVEDKVIALQMKKAALLKDLLDESAIQSAKVDLSTLKSLFS